MWRELLSWFGVARPAPAPRAGAAPPAAPPAGAARLPKRRAGGAGGGASVAGAPAAEAAVDDPAARGAYGVRRPLIGRSGQVAAFEWRLPPPPRRGAMTAAAAASDGDAAAARWLALLAAARLARDARRDVLVELAPALLQRDAVLRQIDAGTWVLSPAAAADTALRDALQRRGARVGIEDGPPAAQPPADFVVLRAAAGGCDTLLLSAERWQQARPGVRLVALGLDGVGDVERVLAHGVELAGGRLGSQPAAGGARTVQAAAHRICALLNDLALDRDTAVVAAAIRADAVLAWRLLRYANSPAVGASRPIDSVEAATMLLGRAELTRWLTVMLLATADARQASAALQEDALARGRLLESLASGGEAAPPQSLFTLGMLSRLDVLLQMPLADALAPLRLSESLEQALLRGSGPLAPALALLDALEGDDESRLADAAAAYGGVDAVLDAAGRAWRWAADVAHQAK